VGSVAIDTRVSQVMTFEWGRLKIPRTIIAGTEFVSLGRSYDIG